MKTYFIRSEATGRIKIGRSQNPEARFRALSTAAADALELIGTVEGDRELELHAQFAESRVRGEWFRLSPELADYLKALFGCVLPEADAMPTRRVAPVETWGHIVDRAERLLGVGLRHTDHDRYAEAGYDFYFRLRTAQEAEGRARIGPDEQESDAADEREATPASDADAFEESIAEEIDTIIYALVDWWPWVLGYAFTQATNDASATITLLFQKPGTPDKIDHLCRLIGTLGGCAYGLDAELRVAVAVRRRSETDEWIGEILGPASIDDEAEIWGHERGILTPILIDAKFGFALLGDLWYRRAGVPTPAEENLLEIAP